METVRLNLEFLKLLIHIIKGHFIQYYKSINRYGAMIPSIYKSHAERAQIDEL